MKVYILSSPENTLFAKELLSDVKKIKIIEQLSVDTDINASSKQQLESADIILAIIDHDFINSTYLKLILQLAQNSFKEKLLPIILNNVAVPIELQNSLYISCPTKSDLDVATAKSKLEHLLTYKEIKTANVQIHKAPNMTSSMLILTFAIELFAILYLFIFFQYQSSNIKTMNDSLTLLTGTLTILLAIFSLITSYLSIIRSRRHEEAEKEMDSYSKRLKKAITPAELKLEELKNTEKEDITKGVNALGRMMINLEDIKEFYTWSQKQAKASFILAVATCILGFLLIVVAIVLPLVFKLNIEMSIAPAIGGVITELIAGTALVVYRHSLSQLNHYHKALHEDERFLSSVNLLGKFSTVEAQDEMLREIIRSEIQMNLGGLSEDSNMNFEKTNDKK